METFVCTILVGVSVIVAGQIVLRFFIEPAQQLKKTLGAISHLLLSNRVKLMNAVSDEDLSSALKSLSAELVSTSHLVSWCGSIRKIFSLPPRESILEASQCLIILAHGMLQARKDFQNSTAYAASKKDFAIENSQAISEIGRLLNIPTSYTDDVQILY